MGLRYAAQRCRTHRSRTNGILCINRVFPQPARKPSPPGAVSTKMLGRKWRISSCASSPIIVHRWGQSCRSPRREWSLSRRTCRATARTHRTSCRSASRQHVFYRHVFKDRGRIDPRVTELICARSNRSPRTADSTVESSVGLRLHGPYTPT